MNEQTLYAILWALILGPVALGALARVSPGALRSIVVTLAALVTIATSLLLASGPSAEIWMQPVAGHVAAALEGIIILVVLAIAVRMKSLLICLLAIAQLGLAAYEHLSHHAVMEAAAFKIDPLAMVMTLIVSIIGSLIVLYAIGYMKIHEHHAPVTARSTGTFFFWLVGFLGAMNGLVLANNLLWLGVFWEATTLCSFMLIGHDQTEEAKRNARRALLVNTFGGLALIGGSVLAAHHGVASLDAITPAAGGAAVLALVCLAAFTKSAQLPFQSWLLGAMVAPTPVSALLHSATMVNAGVYVILRLSPAFMGEKIMFVIALAGAFTFTLTSALAIGQSNGKKVLAYSTIANLGLIITCAAINSPLAYAAAVMILCFHAASKGLLFLCMGTIEQEIGSRDIEDMGALPRRMPFTTTVTLIGMASMLAPPFGMLLSKWLAIEAAANSLIILLLLVLGSALTVMFWAKWIGRITTVSYHPKYTMERLHLPTLVTMGLMCLIVIGTGLAAVPVFNWVVVPITRLGFKDVALAAGTWDQMQSVGAFLTWPFFVFIGLITLVCLMTLKRVRPEQVRSPFLCGENIPGSELSYEFRGPMDKIEAAWQPSFYFRNIFSEGKLTPWANLAAWAIIITMFELIRAA